MTRRDGAVALSGPVGAASRWTDEAREAAHRAVAERLAPCAPGRLGHLLGAGVSDERLVEEALATADRLEGDGRFADALAALERALVGVPGEVEQRGALERSVRLALEAGDAEAVERLRGLVEGRVGAAGDVLVGFLEAEAAVRAGDGARALALLDALPEFEDRWLQAARVRSVRLVAARLVRGSDEDVLASLAEGAADDPITLTWRAMLAYRRGDVSQAATWHEAAAQAHETPGRRSRAMLTAASCWLSGAAHERAAAQASAGREAAKRCRIPELELRAEWLLRSIDQKRGVTEPDDALVGVARAFDASVGEAAQALMVEAYIAWEAGDRARTARLAREAGRRFEALGIAAGQLICEGLAAAAAGDAAQLRGLDATAHPLTRMDLLLLLDAIDCLDLAERRELDHLARLARARGLAHVGLFPTPPTGEDHVART